MRFLKYFFYLAYNWNFKIAWHILKHEMQGEKHFGIDTTGADNLKSLEKKGIDISNATIYMPVSYDVLYEFFDKVNLKTFKHFLDIGCGKGRAMCIAASYGVGKISGVELSKDLYNDARKNLNIIENKYPNAEFDIYNNDAFYFEIDDDVDCIFMFNPFDEVIMSAVMENIETSIENNPRKITIIYINPLQKEVLTDWGYEQVYHSKKLEYLEGAVFVK
jgi:SAM-dependent methyltransferase